jgi:hypothetical protein
MVQTLLVAEAICKSRSAGIVLAQEFVWSRFRVLSDPEKNNYGVLLYRKPTLQGSGLMAKKRGLAPAQVVTPNQCP